MVSSSEEIFFEKHFQNVINREICDYFTQELHLYETAKDIPTVIQTPSHYIINHIMSDVYILAIIMWEVPPLYILNILKYICELIEAYFGSCTYDTICENRLTVYQILDEMIDHGFPLISEGNIIMELVKPPSIMRMFAEQVTGSSSQYSSVLPESQFSIVPWRCENITYAKNECYFDFIETLNAVLSHQGGIIRSYVSTQVFANVRLSNYPDLTVTFDKPLSLGNVHFHRCVRFKNWDKFHQVSFIPPDKKFKLIEYVPTVSHGIPMGSRVEFYYPRGNNNGSFNISLKPNSKKIIQSIIITTKLHPDINNIVFDQAVNGKIVYNQNTNIFVWTINQLTTPLCMKSIIYLKDNAKQPDWKPKLSISYKLAGSTICGIKISKIDVKNTNYKCFKGVKYITKTGNYEQR
ncbi:AP-3 complex subunit mu, partial [Intoshia linei]